MSLYLPRWSDPWPPRQTAIAASGVKLVQGIGETAHVFGYLALLLRELSCVTAYDCRGNRRSAPTPLADVERIS